MPFSFDNDNLKEPGGSYSAERPVVEIVIGEGVACSTTGLSADTPIVIPPLSDISYKYAEGHQHVDAPMIPPLQSSYIQPYAGLPLATPYGNFGLGPEPTLDDRAPLPVMPSLDDEGTLNDEAGSSVFFHDDDDGRLYRSPPCDETSAPKKCAKIIAEKMSDGEIGRVRAPYHHTRVSHQKNQKQTDTLPSVRLRRNRASGKTLEDVIKSGRSDLVKEFKKVTASIKSRQGTVVGKMGVLHAACFDESMQVYISQTSLPSRISTNEFVVHSTDDDLMRMIEPDIESIRRKMHEMSRRKAEFYNSLVDKYLFDNHQDSE